jgi:hypothetical protein
VGRRRNWCPVVLCTSTEEKEGVQLAWKWSVLGVIEQGKTWGRRVVHFHFFVYIVYGLRTTL